MSIHDTKETEISNSQIKNETIHLGIMMNKNINDLILILTDH